MQGVKPFLAFAHRGEEAVNFYTSLLPNSRVLDIQRYGPGGPLPEGSLMWATFELDGREFAAFDGGPTFKFEEGFSMFVTCDTQEEIDRLWTALSSDGGEAGRCGWLKDRFGLSWQVVPAALGEMMGDPTAGDPGRMMEALLQMNKLDIAELRRAYKGASAA